MNIVFVISSMGSGGAERVASILCNAWAGRGHSVTLVKLDGENNPSFYDLHASIELVSLGVAQDSASKVEAIKRNFKTQKIMRKILKGLKPDCIISFLATVNVTTILSSLGSGVPVVISERNYPPNHPIPSMWHILRRITYPMADILVTQTSGIRDLFSRNVRRKSMVIPNPVVVPDNYRALHDASKPGPMSVVSVGRLTREKRHDLLVEAFAHVSKKHESTLTILGEGPLREELDRKVKKLGIQRLVSFPGTTKNPFSVLQNMDLFVLSSESEGFPNALMEAMAIGLPVISFNCPYGPGALIDDGVNGRLVPPLDVKALSEAMDDLLSNPEKRHEMGRRALGIKERYSTERILDKWDIAIATAINKRRFLKHPQINLNQKIV